MLMVTDPTKVMAAEAGVTATIFKNETVTQFAALMDSSSH